MNLFRGCTNGVYIVIQEVTAIGLIINLKIIKTITD